MPTNMKLSDLVKFKEELVKHVNIDSITHQITDYKTIFTNLKRLPLDNEFLDYLAQAESHCDQAIQTLQQDVTALSDTYNQIQTKVNAISSKYFAANYQMNLLLDEEGERRTRDKAFSDHAKEILTKRLRLYSDWHYPALEIGPGRGTWTGELVGNDPLYLVDIRQSYLDETMANFNETYRRRLRPYLLNSGLSNSDLSALPQHQFGFVVSINVFEYFDFDFIRQYLEEVWNILRPGGVFLFTYNNGERSECAKLAENGTVSYIPKSMLITFCETHGYEVIETFDLDATVCWIEIRKPGEKKTVKAHQAMGEIKFKTS